ncbi:hypothetical protein LIER_35484 [Lithospermum erythrorhizon]|uniref:Reverse transcriptase n=1 Tax=Lithospermum erythrorhizon TaxID=34254 RepID=A0AAV3NS72_LITER
MIRRRRNRIVGIEDGEGRWREREEQVEVEVLRYFGEIFKENAYCIPEKATQTVDTRVADDMNRHLIRVVTSEEVKRAVFEMPTDKSPGPDGRIMTNRLRSVLMNIISENQSAFLPGRIISDNILIAHEVLHYMNSRPRNNSSSMAIKLDMTFLLIGLLEVFLGRLGDPSRGNTSPRSSFLDTKLGTNHSFGWRSLLEGREVLLKGVCWRVGDGCSINMWTEPWVQRNIDFFLQRSKVIDLAWYRNLFKRSVKSRRGRESFGGGGCPACLRLWLTSPLTLRTSGGPWQSFIGWWEFL